MAGIELQNNVFQLLEKFNNGEIPEIDNLSEELLAFSIKYEKYDGAINSAVARVIINLQDMVYRTAAISMYGKNDIRLLKDDLRNDLELAFGVTNNCTSVKLKAKDLIKVLKSLPAKDRIKVIMGVALIVAAIYLYPQYLSDKKEVKIHKQYNETIRLAIEKLGGETPELPAVIKNTEKAILTNVSSIDDNVTLNGVQFSSKELTEVKEIMFPPKTKGTPKMMAFEGDYFVSVIGIAEEYVNAKNVETGVTAKFYFKDDGDLFHDRQYLDNKAAIISNLKEVLEKTAENKDTVYRISGHKIINEDGTEVYFMDKIQP